MIIANKYEMQRKLNQGEFGTIFKARHIRTEEDVAIKIEPRDTQFKLLKNEAIMYQFMGGAVDGVPQMKWYGTWEEFTYLVLPLLGNSLHALLRLQRRFSVDLALHLGREMVGILRNVHAKGLIHRDVKPDNFLVHESAGEIEGPKKLYLIDFGFCRSYLVKGDAQTHIAMRNDKKDILGTPAYVSLHIHAGCEPSRRDDLESVGYCMLLFLCGTLPWMQSVDAAQMRFLKLRFLEDGPGTMGEELSVAMAKVHEFIARCNALEFNEKPDYVVLVNLLQG